MPVHVLTPCYRSDPRAAFEWAKDHDCQRVSLEVDNALLPLARARLVATFLEGDCPWALFRDDDVDLPTADIQAMVDLNEPAVLAPYRLRGRDRTDHVSSESGALLWGGLGCALVARHVLSLLWVRHYVELHFWEEDHQRVDLFRPEYAELNGNLNRVQLKEDHAFWHRVREAGYPLTAYLAHTTHAGM